MQNIMPHKERLDRARLTLIFIQFTATDWSVPTVRYWLSCTHQIKPYKVRLIRDKRNVIDRKSVSLLKPNEFHHQRSTEGQLGFYFGFIVGLKVNLCIMTNLFRFKWDSIFFILFISTRFKIFGSTIPETMASKKSTIYWQ